MDDLSGLDWSSTSANKTSAPATTNPLAYSSLRPTPSPLGSGRNTPLSSQGSGLPSGLGTANKPGAAAPAKPAQDSFSGLISFGSAKNTAKLSLLERQELLNAEKRRKEEAQRAAHQATYGNGQFFDMLGRGGSSNGSGAASPAVSLPGPGTTASSQNDDGDDALFAAFKADTKVDQASYYPPAAADSGRSSRQPTPANASGAAALDLSSPSAWGAKPAESTTNNNDDDDPFGLSAFQAKANAPPPPNNNNNDDDDDFLGDLGRPVEEVRREAEAKQREKRERQQQQRERERQQQRQRSMRQPEPGKPIEDSDSDSSRGGGNAGNTGKTGKTGNPAFDQAVAQLVDYGFSIQDAQRGLTESGRGTDVQAAVNWLLDDAHRRAKEKAQGKQGGGGGAPPDDAAGHRSRYPPNRTDSRSPAATAAASVLGDGDFAKTAAVVGSQFLKTANSLWKTGQKRVQKAVQDFQQDAAADPSQPRWMRDAAYGHDQDEGRPAAAAAAAATTAATDEAMMLESGPRPERRQPANHTARQTHAPSRTPSQTTASRNNSPVPRWQQQQQPPPQAQQQTQQRSGADPRLRLTKQALEEESAQAYVSPARRRRTPAAAAAPSPSPPPANDVPEGDLLNSTALPQRPAARPAAAASASAGRPAQARASAKAPAALAPRRVPAVPAGVLAASAQQRAAGAAHFKRGDYAAAHAAYSAALTGLPASHPLLAVLFCNRALTALKTGEPRQAVADADAALAVIGPGRGAGEAVALEDGTAATRDLAELYGKALTRKAEALEQMEKWAEAGGVWQQCVEAGVGGATALAGKQRCQKALAPKPATARPARPTKPAAARPAKPATASPASSASPAASVPTSASGQDFAAVARLRAANAAAEREDAEKLALADKVDARIAAWRDGKKDNLRALLGSMDAVLWAGSGWKPVGLHELVMPGKVKVAYMRAIAKTHPDKLPPDASTEVRMVAATVFATLNESWDKFKADNGM